MPHWIRACSTDDIAEEDVIRFDQDGRTFALYRSAEDEYFATDGLCSHEQVHLADGLVMDDIIECPKHNGRFNYKTGEPKVLRSASISGPIRSGVKPAPSSSISAERAGSSHLGKSHRSASFFRFPRLLLPA